MSDNSANDSYYAHNPMMALIIPGVAGILLALGLLAVTRQISSESEQRVLAVGLASAAGVYVVFAVLVNSGTWIAVEAILTISFSLLALLGLRLGVVLALGWMLHVGWDVIHHHYLTGVIVPQWYPPLCMTFDAVVSVYLLYTVVAGYRQVGPE